MTSPSLPSEYQVIRSVVCAWAWLIPRLDGEQCAAQEHLCCLHRFLRFVFSLVKSRLGSDLWHHEGFRPR